MLTNGQLRCFLTALTACFYDVVSRIEERQVYLIVVEQIGHTVALPETALLSQP